MNMFPNGLNKVIIKQRFLRRTNLPRRGNFCLGGVVTILISNLRKGNLYPLLRNITINTRARITNWNRGGNLFPITFTLNGLNLSTLYLLLRAFNLRTKRPTIRRRFKRTESGTMTNQMVTNFGRLTMIIWRMKQVIRLRLQSKYTINTRNFDVSIKDRVRGREIMNTILVVIITFPIKDIRISFCVSRPRGTICLSFHVRGIKSYVKVKRSKIGSFRNLSLHNVRQDRQGGLIFPCGLR